MANIKINKLDETLIKNIRDCINNSTGNNWKKEWRCPNLPVNGISGRPFSSETEFQLFFVQNQLNARGNPGNRWFSFNQVGKNNLWNEPNFIYTVKEDDGSYSQYVHKEDTVKDGLKLSIWKYKEHIEKKDLFKEKWREMTVSQYSKEDVVNKYLSKFKYTKQIIPTPVYAYSASPFYQIHYKDEMTEKLETYKENNRDIFFTSELRTVIENMKAKGIGDDRIYVRMVGNKITPLYHESQLNQENLKQIKTPKMSVNKDLEKLDVSDLTNIAKAINLSSLVLNDTESHGEAFYSPQDDKVVIPSAHSFKSKDALFATAFHELTHSTGHKDRLNRPLNNSFGSKGYAKEELVAEIGSIFLCNQYGVNSDEQMENHGEYLKNWLNTVSKPEEKEKQDREILFAISQASKAYRFINNAMDKELEKEVIQEIETPISNNDDPIVAKSIVGLNLAIQKEIEKDNEMELTLEK